MTINGWRKYLILLIINDCCYLKNLTKICVKMCQSCAKLRTTVLNCVKVCQSVRKLSQRCQIIKLNWFLMSNKLFCAKLCQSVPKWTKVCQLVLNLCKISKIYLLQHSFAQFGIVWHTYRFAQFHTLKHSAAQQFFSLGRLEFEIYLLILYSCMLYSVRPLPQNNVKFCYFFALFHNSGSSSPT